MEERMDPKKLIKQMVDFNRTAFENTFNAISMLQDQMERMSSMLLEQSPAFPEEGKKAIKEWLKAYKTGREAFKKAVDEGYKRLEDFLGEA
jgi:hypothetical protein